jgi:DNA-binding Lrp family transcriptional regulator
MGKGTTQIKDALKNQKLILSVLSDGKWHRHREILEKTKLSPTTLSKHLKELEKGIVEKRIDLQSGEYPYPVYYRLNQSLAIIQSFKRFTRPCLFTLENRLPRLDLYVYQKFIGELLLQYLIEFSENPKKQEEQFNQAIEYFVLEDFREWIQALKEIVRKLKKENVNITEILKEELTRYTEESEAFIEGLKLKKEIGVKHE